jgi:hypothetical protein
MDSDHKFTEWMRQVDACLTALCGMVSDDLPDFDYRKAYDAKRTPAATARAAFRAARDF